MQRSKKKSSLPLIWRFMYGSKRWFVLGIAASLLVTLVDMVLPQIYSATVDSVIGDEPFEFPAWVVSIIDSIGGAAYLRANIWVVALVVAGLALVSSVGKFFNTYFNTRASETLVRTIRDTLFSHIQRLPFAWHMKHQTGDIIQRCTSDVDVVRNFLSEQLLSVFRIVILLSMSLYFMYSMHMQLALIASLTFPIIVFYSMYFNSRISKHFRECDENEGILSTIAQENLTGVRVVRAFGQEAYERERFEKQNLKYTGLWGRMAVYMTAFWGVGDLITGLQVLVVIAFGTVFCVQGTMSPGEFIAFIVYNSMLVWPVRQLGRVISNMSKAGVSISRIGDIMYSPVEQDAPGAEEPDMSQEIRFENVNFSYDENTPEILHDVSFSIQPGTTFAVLGGTGSGKTTMMHLLCRLYDLPADQGRITVGGVDLQNIKAAHVRRNIGIVLQEPFLFSRTIAENIGIGGLENNMEAIRRAAATACVDDAILGFPEGYDTVVGERGVTLSGGQKQRAAIARTLAKETPIMIFDDSLSAVDAETDAKIRKALAENRGSATVILISHRITTLMQAEKILVLNNGRVEAIGTHEELIARPGTYRDIYRIQTGKEDSNE
jgi:ATP-binding cassette subfamily B protein